MDQLGLLDKVDCKGTSTSQTTNADSLCIAGFQFHCALKLFESIVSSVITFVSFPLNKADAK